MTIWVPKRDLILPRRLRPGPARQRGFLLSPYRFGPRRISAEANLVGSGDASFAGAGVSAAMMSGVAGVGAADWVGDRAQTVPAALSSDGAGIASFAGGGINGGALDVAGAGTAAFVSEPALITVDAADFDGSAAWLSKSSAMSGMADSKTGIFSVWVKFDTLSPAGGSTKEILALIAGGFDIFRCNVTAFFNRVNFNIGTSAPSGVITWASQSFAISTTGWHHILFAWDSGNAYTECYINGTQLTASGDAITNAAASYSAVDLFGVANYSGGSNISDCGMAELYFAPGQFLDITNAANRRKFSSGVGGKPVDLGGSGASPTGTNPLIYLHLDDGESAANFASNRTGAGNLTVTGALTTFASSPSD